MTKTVVITGAGSGFGRAIAFRLSEAGMRVIATTEVYAQVSTLKAEMRERGLDFQVEKLDVTDANDREKVLQWDVDVLLNNAGVSEGGAVVDIPLANVQRQFDVNVFGPLALTQLVAKQMMKKRSGKIIFMSSVAGLTVDPFTGAYSASKHAVEAFAEALYKEMKEYNVAVTTINPGPFFTGFNDRMFETYKGWEPQHNEFNYDALAFPHEQYKIHPVVETTVNVVLGKETSYRNVEPKEIIAEQQHQLQAIWSRDYTEDLGERDPLVQTAYDMKPETKKP